jgi:hypothetical protein
MQNFGDTYGDKISYISKNISNLSYSWEYIQKQNIKNKNNTLISVLGDAGIV